VKTVVEISEAWKSKNRFKRECRMSKQKFNTYVIARLSSNRCEALWD
jgi:hypothetical protein